MNLNWLTIRALYRQSHVPGAREAAEVLRQRTLDMVARGYESFGTVFEFYDSAGEVAPTELDRKGHKACGGVRDYHFKAACVFSLLHDRPPPS